MIAMRSALRAIPAFSRSAATAEGATTRRSPRFFSDGKGRVLSEEERAAENIYIQKMERERLEKLKKQQEREEKEKAAADKEKKSDGKN